MDRATIADLGTAAILFAAGALAPALSRARARVAAGSESIAELCRAPFDAATLQGLDTFARSGGDPPVARRRLGRRGLPGTALYAMLRGSGDRRAHV